MTIILDGTTGITSPNDTTGNQSYTGTLTGGTGVVNLGSGQFYKDASGNVGIGTNSPSSKLTVSGSAATLGQFISSGSATYIEMDNSSGGGYVGTTGNNLVFLTSVAGTERMRIDASGNVGIGTSSPSTRLQVAGSSIFQDTVQIFNNPTSSAQGILFRNPFNVGASRFSMGAATTNGLIEFIGGNGTQGAITGNGAGISYTSASDYRLKENVFPMINALGIVARLKPCTYTWKYNGSAGQGFIAHELQELVPEAVTGKKDAVDEDGNIKPQGIDTSFLVATLTAAIQEQQALITQLQADVAALKVQP